MGSCMRPVKCCWVGQKWWVTWHHRWFERVLYADYNYIRTVLIRSIYMWLCEKKAVFAKCSRFDNLYNAKVEANENALYCRWLLGLQSPAHHFLDLRIGSSWKWGHAWDQLNGVEWDKKWWVTWHVTWFERVIYAD